MANDQITYQAEAGLALYMVIRNDAAQVWSVAGADWETHTAANWGDYDTALAESPADSGKYVATFPAAIAAGRYTVDVHWMDWQAAYHTDSVLATQVMDWGGAAVTPPNTVTVTPLSATVSAGAVTANRVTAYQHMALGPYVWTITDDNGDAVSQAGDTVEMAVYALSDPDTELWSVAGSVSGGSNNIVTVSQDDTNTGVAGLFGYRLVNVTDDVVLNTGTLTIVAGPDVEA